VNTIKPLWSVLETTVRSRFAFPTSLKQFEDVLQEECYRIPPQMVQNFCVRILKRTKGVVKANYEPTPY
jgi:hypothetical protein